MCMRADFLSTAHDAGGAIVPRGLSRGAAGQDTHALPHPLRHRPGRILQDDQGRRAAAKVSCGALTLAACGV
jgi:hypothetical protein